MGALGCCPTERQWPTAVPPQRSAYALHMKCTQQQLKEMRSTMPKPVPLGTAPGNNTWQGECSECSPALPWHPPLTNTTSMVVPRPSICFTSSTVHCEEEGEETRC